MFWKSFITHLQEGARLFVEAIDGEDRNPDENGKGHQVAEDVAPGRVDVVAVRQQRVLREYHYQKKLHTSNTRRHTLLAPRKFTPNSLTL